MKKRPRLKPHRSIKPFLFDSGELVVGKPGKERVVGVIWKIIKRRHCKFGGPNLYDLMSHNPTGRALECRLTEVSETCLTRSVTQELIRGSVRAQGRRGAISSA